jgi:hypothetical protein
MLVGQAIVVSLLGISVGKRRPSVNQRKRQKTNKKIADHNPKRKQQRMQGKPSLLNVSTDPERLLGHCDKRCNDRLMMSCSTKHKASMRIRTDTSLLWMKAWRQVRTLFFTLFNKAI